MRDILEKNKNIKNLIFDTTGTGYFEAGKAPPETAELNAALEKERALKGVKISTLGEVEMPKADAVFEIQVAGLA
ncbi:MAG: hypothetical protein JNK78_17885 [Planctomycetes bacterium]|nr:hypothetical protein [Planctomycetota bacterium]